MGRWTSWAGVLAVALIVSCVDTDFRIVDAALEDGAAEDAALEDAALEGSAVDAGRADGGDASSDAGDASADVAPDVPPIGCPTVGEECDDLNACTIGETCQADGCGGGEALACDAPERTSCRGDVLIRETSPGTCDPASGCVVETSELECPYGCSADACDACVETGWSFTPIPVSLSDGALATASFVVDEVGGQHVAYIEDAPGSEFLEPSIRYAFRASDGDAWATEQAIPPAIGVSRAILGVAAGSVHLMHWDGVEWSYSRRVSMGNWSTEVLPGSGYRTDADMVVTPDGSVHILRGRLSTLSYTRRDGGGWLDTNVPGVRRTSEIDGVAASDGTIHFAFRDDTDDLGYAHFDGSDWAIVSIPTAEIVRTPSIAVGRDGQDVHVLLRYDTNDHLYYAKRPSALGSWSVRPLLTTIERFGDENAIAVDAGGGVHIAFRNMTRRRVDYGYAPPGGSFTFYLFDDDNGFSLNLHVDDRGDVRFVDEAVLPIAGDELRFARRRVCY